MATWFSDLFSTGSTVLASAHTSDSGGTWALAAGASPIASVYATGSGIMASGAASTQVVRTSVISSSPNADTTWNLHVDNATAYTTCGPAIGLASDASSGYIAIHRQSNSKWEIYRLGASLTTTLLATSAGTYTYTNSSDISNVVLSKSGTGATVTVTLKIGGTTVVSYADTDAARVTGNGYAGFWFSTTGTAGGIWVQDVVAADAATAAASITVTPPSPASGVVGVASGSWTVGADGTITGTVVVTPSDSGGGGTFSPTTVSISSGSPTGTFTYTPASSGAKSISVTNDGSLSNPGASTYTATGGAATALTLTGPGSGTVGSASSAFTASANGTLSGSVTVTPSDGGAGGSFSPATVTLNSGTLSANFTYTAASAGAKTISITNGGGLTNPSSLTYTAIAGTVTAPVPPTVADRVKGTASAASGSSITLTGAAASGYRSLAAAFSVGAQGIPVLVQDQTTPANWMVCRCTLTSSTLLTVTSIDSSSNAGAAPTFDGGTKDVTVVMPAKMAYKAPCIDLSDYNIDPTFTVDSTAAIQAAINDAYNRRIEKIKCPPGRYKIAGALTGSGNCQLYIPQTREGTHNRSIYIEGTSPPNFEQQGLRDVSPPDNGTIFESTITGSGTRPSVIGAEQGNSGDAWIWNYTNAGLTNIGIRTRVSTGASSMCGVNFEYLAQVPLLDMLRVDVDSGLQSMPTPNSSSVGVILPPVNNHLALHAGFLYISGYYTGIRFGEHTQIDNLAIVGAARGIELTDSPHGSHIGMYSAEHVAIAFYINGNHPLTVVHYDTEHNTSIAWATYSTDIYKATGSRKIAILRSTVVVGGVGYNEAAFASNDATIYKIVCGAGAN